MQEITSIKYTADNEKSVLSSECSIHKTGRFLIETRRFAGTDPFLTKISEGIILNLDRISPASSEKTCFCVETEDGEHMLFFKLGLGLITELPVASRDIIFFKYLDKVKEDRKNDQRFVNYLKAHKQFSVVLRQIKDSSSIKDFNKLYNLSNSDHVNFPMLNLEQKKIVAIEDQNVLVQGVAGSGKTNICISKIVFSACREYAGRVLYTTFSRGLLIDTESKVLAFKQNLISFAAEYESGRIVFTDKNHKKAIENRLGVYFDVTDEEEKILSKIKRIIAFLETKVDYYLIEDLYTKYVSANTTSVNENYFIKSYIKSIKNHQLNGKLSRIGHLSYEVIYKEIYGLILGSCDFNSNQAMLTLPEYTEIRKDSFSKPECEIIHSLAQDYIKHLAENNLTDNNIMSRKLIEKTGVILRYSLAVIDEVQDMTEVNLCLMKSLCRKMFCVGDALQMINPSYFSFAYLKRLLYEKDVVSVAELSNNYRNTRRIADIIEGLSELNASRFGIHSFVLHGESVDSGVQTAAVYVKNQNFIENIAKENYDNVTIIVSGVREKEELRKTLKKQEILTISEIKGLERDTVILYNVLSDNIDKWEHLERALINRKCADENSVYRYYFNLFYVGVSRAKNYLYVAETLNVRFFADFLSKSFENMDINDAISSLTEVVGKIETDQDELIERVRQFVNLEQYDNARFAANKIQDDVERTRQLTGIGVFEEYISRGKYREAGIAFWEKGILDEARKYFKLSGDNTLLDLFDVCSEGEGKALGVDIVQFFTDVANNEAARKLILQAVANDYKQLSIRQTAIDSKFNSIKEKTNG